MSVLFSTKASTSVGGHWEIKYCPGCILDTIWCRKLIFIVLMYVTHQTNAIGLTQAGPAKCKKKTPVFPPVELAMVPPPFSRGPSASLTRQVASGITSSLFGAVK